MRVTASSSQTIVSETEGSICKEMDELEQSIKSQKASKLFEFSQISCASFLPPGLHAHLDAPTIAQIQVNLDSI